VIFWRLVSREDARANLSYDVLLLSPFSKHRRFQDIGVHSARYQSIRENLGSEVDFVDSRHVILEVHHVVEN
jgi:hypothetical protein